MPRQPIKELTLKAKTDESTSLGWKVLYVAFACEPGRGSEPGIGWNFVEEASRRRPVWVITDASYRAGIEAHLKTKHRYHPIHVTYVKVPFCSWLFPWDLSNNVYYYLWQFFAARKGRALHQAKQFDLVHHVSYERYWMHSAGASIGPPFLFGPVGGGEFYPDGLRKDLPLGIRMISAFASGVRRLMEYDPFLRRTLSRAAKIIPSVHIAADRIRGLGYEPEEVMVTLLPEPKVATEMDREPSPPFTFISIGRIPYWKGIQLAIEAFARTFGPEGRLRDKEVEYLIIGDGTYKRKLEELATKLGVASKIQFLGDLPYAQCIEHLRNADAMLHPSMRDSAGLVYESLTLGVPVIALEVGMPALLIDELSGALISTKQGLKHVVKSLAETMETWVETPELVEELRVGAAERSQKINRVSRADVLEGLYDQVAKKQGERP